jgi:hypothetical protein
MAVTIGSVIINKNPANASHHWNERLNQITLTAADGSRITYGTGPNVLKGLLVIINVDTTEGETLITYLRDTAVFGANSFTIVPPTGVNLGSGSGTSITTAYFDGGTDLSEVLQYKTPRTLCDIRLPYYKVL